MLLGDIVERIIGDYPLPERGYKYRVQCRGKSNKTGKPLTRQFNPEVLRRTGKNGFGSWFVWSKKADGLFCKYCALFRKNARICANIENEDQAALVNVAQ